LICINADDWIRNSTVTKKDSPLSKRTTEQMREAIMAMMPSMSNTDHGTTCVRCGEKLFVPDWSEFVSERPVVNLWSCSRCGNRFETSACMCMSEDAEPKMTDKDWEQMFPPLLVA
jgi:ribosomal protein L37E